MNRFKQTIIRITLSISFAMILALLAFIFIADFYFKKAKELNKQYRWTKAEEFYKRSTLLNPLNAEYFAGHGDFILKQSEYRKGKGKISWLKEAESFYKEAQRLNPRYDKYSYSLGKVNLQLNKKAKAVEYFQVTISQDPHNLLNNYQIGCDLVNRWKHLGSKNRDFAIARLNYVLSRRLYYHKAMYPFLLKTTGDFEVLQKVTPDNFRSQNALYEFLISNQLWRYRKDQKRLVDSYPEEEYTSEFKELLSKKEEVIKVIKEKYKDNRNLEIKKKDWQGLARNGKSIYREGNMYWTGTVNASVYILPEKRILIINARGTAADGIWPYMIVELDGEVIGETFVDSTEWKQYSFKLSSDGELKVVSITFANDGGNKEKNEDRNLYVGDLIVE